MSKQEPRRIGVAAAAVLCAAFFVLGLLVSPGTQAPGGGSSAGPTAASPSSTFAPVAGGCDGVLGLVTSGELERAISQFDTCPEGPARDALLKAIDEAVLRVFQERGCETKPLIKMASGIGASSARLPFTEKGCR